MCFTEIPGRPGHWTPITDCVAAALKPLRLSATPPPKANDSRVVPLGLGRRSGLSGQPGRRISLLAVLKEFGGLERTVDDVDAAPPSGTKSHLGRP